MVKPGTERGVQTEMRSRVVLATVLAIVVAAVVSIHGGGASALRRIIADWMWTDPTSQIHARISRLRDSRQCNASDVAFLEEWSQGTRGTFSYLTLAGTWQVFMEDPQIMLVVLNAKKESALVSDVLRSGFWAYEEYYGRIPAELRSKADRFYHGRSLAGVPGTQGLAAEWDSFVRSKYPEGALGVGRVRRGE